MLATCNMKRGLQSIAGPPAPDTILSTGFFPSSPLVSPSRFRKLLPENLDATISQEDSQDRT